MVVEQPLAPARWTPGAELPAITSEQYTQAVSRIRETAPVVELEGPAQGAFNAWVEGTFLESASQRNIVQVALNIMEGAAIITGAQQRRTYGVAIPSPAFEVQPRPLTLS